THFALAVPPFQRLDHSPSREPFFPAVASSAHCLAFSSLASPSSFTLAAKAFTSSPSGLGTSFTLNGFRVFSASAARMPEPTANARTITTAQDHQRFMEYLL